MTTQQKYLSDIGPPSQGGETSQTLLPSVNATLATSGSTSRSGDRKNELLLGGVMRSGLVSSVAASPASLFQWLEVARGRMIVAGSGIPFAKLFKLSDRDTCWLKTYQDCEVQRTLWANDQGISCEESCETLPTSGTMQNGILCRQPPLVRRISEKESSLLPTPRASEAEHSGRTYTGSNSYGQIGLAEAANLLGTPNAHPRTHSPRQVDHDQQLANQVGGLLNPQFVEAIMGFPIGWTDLDASETP
jgi:hypothetical protein